MCVVVASCHDRERTQSTDTEHASDAPTPHSPFSAYEVKFECVDVSDAAGLLVLCLLVLVCRDWDQ